MSELVYREVGLDPCSHSVGPTGRDETPICLDCGAELLWVKRAKLKEVAGTYEHPWRCHNCWTDHGGPGCDNPDFGEWRQWYEVEDAS